jgi:hypothetical protein
MRLPDYRGGSIVNLMASLQRGLEGETPAYEPLVLLPAAEVREYRQVLLLVVDGLGLNYLQAIPEAACLNARLRGGIDSVFPPTTASAITTFLTGEAPQQHGLTGWHMYFRELGSVLAVLPGKPRYGGVPLAAAGIDVAALFGHLPFADRLGVEAWSLAPAYIAGSDFNLAHLGRARPLSYLGLDELLSQAAALLRQEGRRFVYGYWPDLDSLGHRNGIWSERTRSQLLELDRAFAGFLEQIRGTGTLVLLCADHGQIDTTAADRIALSDHPALAQMLVLPLCGEPRSAYCYLRPGCEHDFDAYVAQELAGVARALPSADLVSDGWFGPGEPHPRLAQRVGDRVLLMQHHHVIKDWLVQERPYELIGVHGGLSADELRVPLIVAAV